MSAIRWRDGSGDVLDGTGTYLGLRAGLALVVQALYGLPFSAWNGREHLAQLAMEGSLRVTPGVALEVTPKGLHVLARHFPRLDPLTIAALQAWERQTPPDAGQDARDAEPSTPEQPQGP